MRSEYHLTGARKNPDRTLPVEERRHLWLAELAPLDSKSGLHGANAIPTTQLDLRR